MASGLTSNLSYDDVLERALQGADVDDVAGLELVEVAERRAVRRAVAGDGGVAHLARERRGRVVAGALAQVVGRHALDDD